MGHRCSGCGGTFAEEALGFVCEHFFRSPAITYRSTSGPVPETMCTGCDARQADDPRTTIRLEALCVGCHERLRATRIAATDEDAARGWALGDAGVYAAIARAAPAPPPPIAVGGRARLLFAKVPAPEDRHAEVLWIRVTERDGARIAGVVDEDPAVIELARGARIEATIDHVIDAA